MPSRSTTRVLVALTVPCLAIAVGATISCAVQRNAATSAAQDRTALIHADSLFMQATTQRGVDGWVEYFSDSGAQVSPKSIVRGHDAIRAHMAPAFADKNDRLDWSAEYANVSRDGSLGYTYGTWTALHKDSTGAMQPTATGRYVTVWRKQPDGRWLAELDTGAGAATRLATEAH